MHTHTRRVVSARSVPLPTRSSRFILGSLGYHDYEGVALRDDEKPRLVANLGERNFLMLRNHGLLTVAGSVAGAFQAMYLFEAACAIQIRAQAGGTLASGDLIEVDPSIIPPPPSRPAW